MDKGIFLQSKITNITPRDDNTKEGLYAFHFSIWKTLGELLFPEMKLPLGEISRVMESCRCCPQFFQRFKSYNLWGPTNRYTSESHSRFITVIVVFGRQEVPRSLYVTINCCPLLCSLPQIAHFLILTTQTRIEPLTLILPAIRSNNRDAPKRLTWCRCFHYNCHLLYLEVISV